MEIVIGDWVSTPDGQGEVVGYDPGQARSYAVMLDQSGVDASGDNLRIYAADEIELAPPPEWKLLRDSS